MARLPVEQRRRQLLAIGRQAFASTPFDTVNLEDVAREAGVSKGLLYHHFDDKRGYYQAVLGQVAVEVLEVTVFPSDVGVDVAVRQAVDGFLTYTLSNEPFYRALVRGGIGSDPAVDAQLEGVRRTLVDRIVDRLGLEATPRVLRTLYGWIGFAELTTLDWLADDRDVPSHADHLTRSLLALLELT